MLIRGAHAKNAVVPGAALASLVCLFLSPGKGTAQIEDHDLRPRARQVVQRSLPLLQKSADTWIQKKTCASCHHQGLGLAAVSVAAEKGFDPSVGLVQKQIAATRRSAGRSAQDNGQQEGPINGQFGIGYALFGLRTAGEPASSQTDMHAYFLGGKQDAEGGWRSASHRPPMEDSHFTSTALAVFALQSYTPSTLRERTTRQLAEAAHWLRSTPTLEHEDRIWRLWGLYWAGQSRTVLNPYLDDVASSQNQDGSWSQYPGRQGDAYATGQALTTLQQIGGDRLTDLSVERGVRWLLADWKHQQAAWHVASRRRFPGLPYFESGYPFGEDQFISFAGSAWAVMALTLAVEPGAARTLVAARVVQRHEPEVDRELPMARLPSLVHSALFDPLHVFARALEEATDEDLEPAGPLGLSVLMAAVDSPEKVALLIARGVDVNAKSELGKTALHLASGRWRTAESMELLLAAGAKVNVADSASCSPLHHAVAAGDIARARRLLALGADASPWCMGETIAGHPLFQAAMKGHTEVAKPLLALGIGRSERFPELGTTALHEAVYVGVSSTVRAMIEGGIDPSATDNEGNSALHYAVLMYRGNEEIASMLIEAGVDPGIRNKAGKTAFELAEKEGYRNLEPRLD